MSTIFLHLANQLDDKIKEIEADMPRGHVKDFGDYKFGCGVYRGLLLAKDVIIETARKLEHDDD